MQGGLLVSTITRPPNSLIFVMDPAAGVLPAALNPSSITVSSSSIAIGTLSAQDGPTEVTLAVEGAEVNMDGLALRCESTLLTSLRIGIVSIENEVLLECNCPEHPTVQVWTNHLLEPDKILVLLTSQPDLIP